MQLVQLIHLILILTLVTRYCNFSSHRTYLFGTGAILVRDTHVCNFKWIIGNDENGLRPGFEARPRVIPAFVQRQVTSS